jgi:pimeloyl-ACP methyl ester carboxylesterase
LARLEAEFPARQITARTPDGAATVAMRERGGGAALVCLHGIGSGAAAWFELAVALGGRARVLAWDAPGYGGSSALPSQPRAADYAARLHDWLDALAIDACVLVGHSLGALMAAAAAHGDRAARIRRLVLLSPALGYGAPGREAARARVHAERLRTLEQLGIAGLAAQRSQRLLGPQADERARRWVRWNMARLNPDGYRQAVELLCAGDLLADLPPPMPVRVACGALDAVTPPESCEAAARRCGVALELLPGAGHAIHLEQPARVAALLAEVLAS